MINIGVYVVLYFNPETLSNNGSIINTVMRLNWQVEFAHCVRDFLILRQWNYVHWTAFIC